MNFIPSAYNILTSTLQDATDVFTYFRPGMNFQLAWILGVGGILLVVGVVLWAVSSVTHH